MIGIQSITTHCHLDSMDFRFCWPKSADKVGISNLATSRDLAWFYKEHCVGACDGGLVCAFLGKSWAQQANLLDKEVLQVSPLTSEIRVTMVSTFLVFTL